MKLPTARAVISALCLLAPAMYAVRWDAPETGLASVGGFAFFVGGVFCVVLLLLANLVIEMRESRPYDALLVVLAPTLFFLTGSYATLAAAMLIVASMYCWATSRLAWSGVCLGVASLFSLLSVLFLVPLLILCAYRRRLLEFAVMLCTGFAAWAALSVAVYALVPEAWAERYVFFPEGSTNLSMGSMWYVAANFPLTGEGLPLLSTISQTGAVRDISIAFFGIVCVGLVLWVRRAQKQPSLAVLVFLTFAGFMLTSIQWDVGWSLFLVPLAALAYSAWFPFLAWQVSEVLFFLVEGEEDQINGGSEALVVWAGLARWVTLAWLAWSVIRNEAESYEEDPDAGVLASRAG